MSEKLELTTKLRLAISENQIEEVRELLSSGSSFLEADEDGSTALDVALKHLNKKMINLLLTFCDISKIDVHNRSHAKLLNAAIEMDEVEFLCRWGSERNTLINVVNLTGQRPLHRACAYAIPHEKGCQSTAYILSHNGDPDVRDNAGATPLHYIASRVQSDGEFASKIYLLIGANADVNARDFSDRTPLHYSKLKSGENCIFELFRFGADINAEDNENETIFDYLYFELQRKGFLKGFEKREVLMEELDFYEPVRICIQHFSSLLVLGLPISSTLERSFDRVKEWYYFIERSRPIYDIFSEKYIEDKLSTDCLATFIDKCEEERQKLINMELVDCVSMYDVLFADQHQMSRLVVQEEFKSYFEEFKYQEDFPILWYFLEIQYRAGIVRNMLKPLATDYIEALELPLPDNCCEMIMQNLTNNELKDLIKMEPNSTLEKIFTELEINDHFDSEII